MKKYFFICFLCGSVLLSFSGCKKDNSLDEFEDIYPIIGHYVVNINDRPDEPLSISRKSSNSINISTYWNGECTDCYTTIAATVSKEEYEPKKKKDKTRKIKYIISFSDQTVYNNVTVTGTGYIYEDAIQLDFIKKDC